MYLDVQHLNKSFATTQILTDIHFHVAQGKFITLLGPSGCGKSTTLNIIAGLETPSSGQIFLKERDITHLAPGKRGISMVFQSYALFPHLSVAENIVFGLKARRVPIAERNRRLKEALEMVDLSALAQKKPAQLSGGQRQRVALARAIVSQAPLCLMDEPLSNLDAKLRQSMRSELRKLQQKLGLTVIYVTHDQVEAMSMADEVILLNRGHIEQRGVPQALYGKPQTVFAAAFIGNPPMNILRTTDADYLLGIRPEQITLVGENEGLAAHFLFSDYHGAETLLTVAVGEQHIKVHLAGHHDFTPGTKLWLSWQPQHTHYFKSCDGRRCEPEKVLSLAIHKERKQC